MTGTESPQHLSSLLNTAKPTLALRMYEVAVAFHPLAPQRLVMVAVAAILAASMLPLWICMAWVAGQIGIEVWCWFSSRKQYLGQSVSLAERVSFDFNMIAMQIWWAALAVLWINTGTATGQACGVLILVTLACLMVLVFHNTPAMFLVAGAIPPTAALSIIAIRSGMGWHMMMPVWLYLTLCLLFCLGRAIDTPSAQETQRKLKETLNQYKILTDNITDFIGRTDLNGVYQYASPSVYTVLGYQPEELIGMRIQDLLSPESSNFEFSGAAQSVAHPDAAMTVTVRVRHKQGHWVWLQTSAKLVVENDRPVGLIGVSRDVTDNVAADLALQEAKAEAEAANRIKAEFLANVSHEIRTPMNAVLGALHLLEHEPISASGRVLIDQALVCGQMLTQIVNDVLDFSKIEAGQLDLTPAPMDLAEALKGVASLLENQAADKGLALTWQVTGEDFWIEADPVRLRQAMFNLLGNAVKFTPKGRIMARLAIEPADRADHCRVRLEVEDTGIGVAPNVRQQLFERFQQVGGDATKGFGGTGLGLAITKALVDMMGGDIGYVSLEGQGSTFWIEFEAPRASPAGTAVLADHLLAGVRVLLVEDNPANRLMARSMLTSLGAQVSEAEDGLVGLEAASLGIFDIVLMDIQMPIMNGIESTRAIRALGGAAANVPIVGLTANVMTHQRVEYEAAGINGVVAKPISPTALISEIIRHLGNKAG